MGLKMTHLRRTDPARNLARYYCAHIEPTLFGEWNLVREWGRIGQPGTVKTTTYSDETSAAVALVLITRRKQRRGYA
jgi:predicted DNA-binding WGR domain protein